MTSLPPGLLPPDLDRLRALRAWHHMWVGILDDRIAQVERAEAERRRGEERRPPPPDWIIQHGIGAGPPMIHTKISEGSARCWARVGRERCAPATREQAMAALTQEHAEACRICRPDTELGILD